MKNILIMLIISISFISCKNYGQIKDGKITSEAIDYYLIVDSSELTIIEEVIRMDNHSFPSIYEATKEDFESVKKIFLTPKDMCKLEGKVPGIIALLINLEALDVRSNKELSFPANILTNLKKLESIKIKGVNECPEFIFKQKNLRTLDLSGNNLTHVPDLTQLKNLNCLYLNENNLFKMPGISRSVEIVNISNNLLHTIPMNLPETLIQINVSNNPLQEKNVLELYDQKSFEVVFGKEAEHVIAKEKLIRYYNKKIVNLTKMDEYKRLSDALICMCELRIDDVQETKNIFKYLKRIHLEQKEELEQNTDLLEGLEKEKKKTKEGKQLIEEWKIRSEQTQKEIIHLENEINHLKQFEEK